MCKKGRAEGKAEGEAKGETKGKAATLTRLLTRRFGPPSEGIRQRIAEADIKLLDRWLDRVLDAPDLESVFAGRRKN